MRQKYTNSSIAWRTEFYNSYFVQISTKTAISEVEVQNIHNNQNSLFFADSQWTNGF